MTEPKDPFVGLSAEELVKVEPLAEEAILEAFEQGRQARQAFLDAFVPPWLPSGLRFR
jgi:hypothetical protein